VGSAAVQCRRRAHAPRTRTCFHDSSSPGGGRHGSISLALSAAKPHPLMMVRSKVNSHSGSETRLRYAIVTPVREEAENLPRLAESLDLQTYPPVAWVVVDTGSTDDTVRVARTLATNRSWMGVVSIVGEPVLTRGRPISRAIQAGVNAVSSLARRPEILVVIDADVSLPHRYFKDLIRAFADDARLGIASGVRFELVRGSWRPQFITGTSVEAQCRAYRWTCLSDVLPLEERFGWAGIDEIQANLRGWRTAVVRGLSFRHHREIGSRERTWSRAYYLGLRSVFKGWRHRDPRALMMIVGFCLSALRAEPRHSDPCVRAYVRRQQHIAHVPRRIREARGRAWS
jgi:hypothetical protein